MSRSLLILLIMAVAPGLLQAQNRPEITTAGSGGIPISFFPPGARALGMGSAFIGVADDATAAESNPAGLTILSEPEVSLHFRYADQQIGFDETNVDAFNQATGANAESRYTLDTTDTRVSFASVVKPFDRWVVSAFFQEAARIDGTALVQALSPGTPFSASFDSFLGITMQHTGVSVSYRLSDFISIGAAFRSSEIEARSGKLSRFDFGAPDSFLEIAEDVRIDDRDFTYTAGVLINPNGYWSFGAVYKKGGTFDIEVGAMVVDQRPGLPAFSASFGPFSQSVEVPDVIGLGVAWRPSDTVLVSLDFNRIDYSVLQDPNVLMTPELRGILEPVEDETSIHFGIEKAYLLDGPVQLLTIRGGIFTDPDHDGFARVDSDNTHYTLGLGVVMGNYQLDAAAEFSENVDSATVSMIYRF